MENRTPPWRYFYPDAPSQQAPTTLGSNLKGHHLWSPHPRGFTRGPKFPCVLIPKLGPGRQAKMSIKIWEANFQITSAQRHPRHAPLAFRRNQDGTRRAVGEVLETHLVWVPARAPPVTAAKRVEWMRIPKRESIAYWLQSLSFTACCTLIDETPGTFEAPPHPPQRKEAAVGGRLRRVYGGDKPRHACVPRTAHRDWAVPRDAPPPPHGQPPTSRADLQSATRVWRQLLAADRRAVP
jgi:hypothetical protein